MPYAVVGPYAIVTCVSLGPGLTVTSAETEVPVVLVVANVGVVTVGGTFAAVVKLKFAPSVVPPGPLATNRAS